MTTLIVAAYGQLQPTPNLLDSSDAEDLYSVFLARSELMRWSNLYESRAPELAQPLWSMEEATLDSDPHAPEIGRAQVGLDVGPAIDATEAASPPTLSEHAIANLDPAGYAYAPHPLERGPPSDPVVAIPPLVQCLDDALRRFGDIDATAFEVSATYMTPERRSQLSPLAGVLNWFNVLAVPPRVGAVATLAADGWDERMAVQTFTFIQRAKFGLYSFGGIVRAPKDDAAGEEMFGIEWVSADTGVAVSLAEWSPAAVGWLIATLFDAVRAHHPATRHLSVRVTRRVA
ncbi:MAG: hypothetical protein F4066_12720 [Chloroflexi bacterium]|nr:hypothetical protein [Chloroflexota bacterium]